MNFILIQGGGDLATGVAVRLRRAGLARSRGPSPLGNEAPLAAIALPVEEMNGAASVQGAKPRKR